MKAIPVMSRIVAILILMLLLSSCFITKKEELLVYQNPISAGVDSHGIRDCQIIRDGDWWYMTGTSYPFRAHEEKNAELNKGVVLYKSKNLVEWQFVKYIIERPNASKWYYRRFWAPEIHRIQDKYYVTFSCRNEDKGYDWQHIGYAVSNNIEGPYTVITDKEPLARGNDLTLFEDDDNKVYAFWHNVLEDGTFWLGSAEIDLKNGKFLTDTLLAISPGLVDYERNSLGQIETIYREGRNEKKIKAYHEWDSQGIEGAYVLKRNGIYYLFYSSWTRGYEIGYATTTNIKGPWKKATNNPIYGGTKAKLCEKRGFNCEKDALSPFDAVGHNAVFKGPDGRLWISCHGVSKYYKYPHLVLDPLNFDKNGAIKRTEPSYVPQVIKLKKQKFGL